MPKLDHTEVIFLPPNTTSRIHPMEAGIIAAVKMRYRRRQLERAMDFIDMREENIYSIDQLTSMRWIDEVWKELPRHGILNYWKHTGLLDGRFASGADYLVEVDTSTQCEEERVEGFLARLVSPLIGCRSLDF